MRYGILGRGFGLYGYLPAVAERTDDDIYTLDCYRETIRTRQDLKAYENRIVFEQDAKALFAHCDAVIIALRPADQESILAGLLDRGWRGMLILEKPLACTPERALSLLERLLGSGITFRIGFTLGATAWFERLTEYIGVNMGAKLTIDFRWLFCAHHYRHNVDSWKRYYAQGGGALRFYAIHMVALLAKWGDWLPLSCSHVMTETGEEPECRFEASLGNCSTSVVCDTKWRGEPSFWVRVAVEGKATLEVRLVDPLCEYSRSAESEDSIESVVDTRVRYLRKILISLEQNAMNGSEYICYMKHATLWRLLENKAVEFDSRGLVKS
jgi:predicted dehydrogenase